MSYKVVAALVLAKNQQGLIQYVYEGGVIPWLSDEQAEHFVSSGLVVEIDDPEPEDDEPEDPADGGKPAEDATNKVLAQWLIDNALKEDGSEYTEAELKPLNKASLWELINAVEEPADGDED